MQPWRVLVLIQVASLRSATTSTRHKKNKSKIEKIERRAKRAFSLTRSKIALFFAWRCIRIFCSKYPFCVFLTQAWKLNILCIGKSQGLSFFIIFFKPAKKLQVCLLNSFSKWKITFYFVDYPMKKSQRGWRIEKQRIKFES